MSRPRQHIDDGGRGGEAIPWVALTQIEGLGAASVLRLARTFGSAEAALAAPAGELVARGRLSPRQADDVVRAGASLGAVGAQIEGWRRAGIALVALGEPEYPPGLLDLRSPPPVLFVRGKIAPCDRRAVAIIGTREPTRQGEVLAERLASRLAERGLTIVSGLARGIDTAGHRGALMPPSGRSVAVLGCGLNCVYPPENGLLGDLIAQRGALLAEVPPDTEVSRRLLLARDRLQAALSQAVIVVQAHAECGSIVTARHARACRRPLFGVPWSRPPFSEGWHRLEEMGAVSVSGTADVDAVVATLDAPGPPRRHRHLLL